MSEFSRSVRILKKPAPPTNNFLQILLSPTAFKGTLTPHQASRILASVLKSRRPSWTVRICPVADGGDGTLDVLSRALSARRRSTLVTGPLGKKVRAEWALSKRTALIEMARASGLALTKGRNRIMDATSDGTGELIRAALRAGARKILIGVGGTATGEGGAGALKALGLGLFDRSGKALAGRPSDLLNLDAVDWKKLDLRLRRAKIFVVCDVTNPLLGPQGSARTFGPQKGATASQIRLLEKALLHWTEFARFEMHREPGAGAAGALAYGLSAFLGAQLVRGTPFVLNAIRWKESAKNADAIVVGEGQLDKTSFSGKTIGEIVRLKGRARVFAICGRSKLSPALARQKGLSGVIEMGPAGLKNPEAALRKAAEHLLVMLDRK